MSSNVSKIKFIRLYFGSRSIVSIQNFDMAGRSKGGGRRSKESYAAGWDTHTSTKRAWSAQVSAAFKETTPVRPKRCDVLLN